MTDPKRALVERFFAEIEALEAAPGKSPFSHVDSQREVAKVLEAVPPKWEAPFVARLYRESLKKLGASGWLKKVKAPHYAAMAAGFEALGPHLGTAKAGMLGRIESDFLWALQPPGTIAQDRFVRNLDFLLVCIRCTNVPSLAGKHSALASHGRDEEIVALARDLIEAKKLAWDRGTYELLVFWGLLYLVMLDESDGSRALVARFLAPSEHPQMRMRVFLANHLIKAKKSDPRFVALREELLAAFPPEWLSTYEPAAMV